MGKFLLEKHPDGIKTEVRLGDFFLLDLRVPVDDMVEIQLVQQLVPPLVEVQVVQTPVEAALMELLSKLEEGGANGGVEWK